ncbi:MAG: DNA-deoxyinosine glycosylase [Spirochaetia bacterium]|jgi:hypoxanthine-DNA glycosylase|nr:DNA-deoxyinosine glycosylase [Spirochaetia bacterium]
MIEAFDAIIGAEPKLLILGSAPSVRSLAKSEYYGHERNAFWKIMDILYNKKRGFSDYEEKKQLLRNNGIALWDVVRRCERKGSLDTAIRNVEPHAVEKLLQGQPTIVRVLFNGKTACSLYRKEVGYYPDIDFLVMPSTSPAYTLPFEEKLLLWQKGLNLGEKAER